MANEDQSLDNLLDRLVNQTGEESKDLEEFEEGLKKLAQKHENAKQTLLNLVDDVQSIKQEIETLSSEESKVRELWNQMRADMTGEGVRNGDSEEFERKLHSLDDDIKTRLNEIKSDIRDVREELNQLEEQFGEEEEIMKVVENIDDETTQDMARMFNIENAITQAEMEIENNH
jgi:predicted  nucleic acid-binding Zn-ribbon protein